MVQHGSYRIYTYIYYLQIEDIEFSFFLFVYDLVNWTCSSCKCNLEKPDRQEIDDVSYVVRSYIHSNRFFPLTIIVWLAGHQDNYRQRLSSDSGNELACFYRLQLHHE